MKLMDCLRKPLHLLAAGLVLSSVAAAAPEPVDSPLFGVLLTQSVSDLAGQPGDVISAVPIGRPGKERNLVLTNDNTATCNGKVTCNGAETCDGTATCNGADTCDGTLTCNGTNTCDGTITCNGTATCNGGNTCRGVDTCNGSHTCNGRKTCTGVAPCPVATEEPPDGTVGMGDEGGTNDLFALALSTLLAAGGLVTTGKGFLA